MFEQDLLPEISEFIAASLNIEYQDRLFKYLIEPPIPNNDENAMNIDITRDHYTNQFKIILDIFQKLICKRLLSRSSSGGFSPNSDPVVIDATKCIAALCTQ
jgi:hypothetical protein